MKNKLSILVPVRNRSPFLSRLLHYLRVVKCEFSVVIADSSDVAYSETHPNFADGLNVKYSRYFSEIPFYEKLMQTVDSISTEYMVMCGDDDFLSMSALESCVSFLDSAPDYSIAHGQAWSIVVNATTGIGNVTPYPQSTIRMETAAERLVKHMTEYAPTAYSVHRTRHVKQAVTATLRSVDKEDFQFGELLLSCIPVCLGKVHRAKEDYLLRQGHSASTTSGQRTWSDEMAMEDFSRRYSNFIRELREVVIECDHLSLDTAENATTMAMDGYFGRFVPGYLPRLMPKTVQAEGGSSSSNGVIKKVLSRLHQLFQKSGRLVPEKIVAPTLIDACSLIEKFPEGMK